METPTEKLMANKMLEKLQIYLIVDFIIKLLLVINKNTILVVYNKLSKMVYFVAIIEKALVKQLVRLFRNNTQKLYKLSESVILDRRPQFAIELTKKLGEML